MTTNGRSITATVVGAGIVGAACAEALADAGVEVTVVDAGATGGGATAAGMGHVLLLDDTQAQFELTRRSRELWDARADEWPAAVEHAPCGTLWVAEDDEELAIAAAKAERFCARGVHAEHVVGAAALRTLEPALAGDLAGGLLLTEDSVIYAPAATDRMLDRVRAHGGRVSRGRPVTGVRRGAVTFADGEEIECDLVVVAAGHHSVGLLPRAVRDAFPALRVVPKKGHLVITERARGHHSASHLQRQVVELGYLKSAHGDIAEAVACNIQPRPTGQLLVGSSRQLDTDDPDVEPAILARMLRRAARFVPAILDLRVLRTWVGFRPASPDHLPWIGPVDDGDHGAPTVMLATGHEGWGMSAALATGELIADLALGRRPRIDPRAFAPDRAAADTVRPTPAAGPRA